MYCMGNWRAAGELASGLGGMGAWGSGRGAVGVGDTVGTGRGGWRSQERLRPGGGGG